MVLCAQTSASLGYLLSLAAENIDTGNKQLIRFIIKK